MNLTSTPQPVRAFWLSQSGGFCDLHTGARLPDDFAGLAWTPSGIFHTGLETTEYGTRERYWKYVRAT